MKYGVIHYRAPGDTLEQFLDWAAETGFDAVELTGGDVGVDLEDGAEKQAGRVRGLLEARGLAVSAVSAGNDFVVLEDDQVQAQVAHMERICRLASLAGANLLRTEGGAEKPEVDKSRHAEAIAGCLKRCLPVIERDRIVLAVDNHGWVTNDPQVLLDVFAAVDSPWIGANLDTGNFRWAGHTVDECRKIYDAIAPHAKHTHIKDCTGCAKTEDYVSTVHGEGEVDLNHAMAALRRVGYNGVYCAEWEGRGDGSEAYAGCLAWMKQNI